jgi:hypothetical protein
MIENLSEFETLQTQLQEIISSLSDVQDSRVEVARMQLSTIEGAIGRYLDVEYPIPFKRPDEPVLDIVNAVIQLGEALRQLASSNSGSVANA